MRMRPANVALSRRAGDDDLGRLYGALDIPSLVALGWDPTARVFAPEETHPLLGWTRCGVQGCPNEAFR